MLKIALISTARTPREDGGPDTFVNTYGSVAGVGSRIFSGNISDENADSIEQFLKSQIGVQTEGEIARKQVTGFKTGMRYDAKSNKLVEDTKSNGGDLFENRTIVRLGTETWTEAAKACGHDLIGATVAALPEAVLAPSLDGAE